MHPKSSNTPSIPSTMQAVLIGGGKQYAGNAPPEQGSLLDVGLEMTGLQNPNVLIVPSARSTKSSHNRVVDSLQSYYHDKGLVTSVLHPPLFKHDVHSQFPGNKSVVPSRVPSRTELSNKIDSANLIFVVGGDTNRMLNQIWRPYGIDVMLGEAMLRGTVFTGSSAGVNVWFKGSHSASTSLKITRSTGEERSVFHYMSGLDHIKHTVACPHYDAHPKDHNISREASFDNMMYRRREEQEMGIGIDENAALQITVGGLVSVLRGPTGGRRVVHTVHYRNGGRKEKVPLSPSDGTYPFTALLQT